MSFLKHLNVLISCARKNGHCHILFLGNKLVEPLWKEIWQHTLKYENILSLPSNSSSRYLCCTHRGSCTKWHIYKYMHKTIFIILKIENNPNVITRKLVSKFCSVYSVEWHKSIKIINKGYWWNTATKIIIPNID